MIDKLPKARAQTASEMPATQQKPTKKEQILSLFLAGISEIGDIAMITGSRPSYVGSVLQDAGLHKGYFDLYTSTARPMNVYSKFFSGKLGFKDEATARASVEVISRLYHQFELAGDRAGQHHALTMALTMYDRARWTNKITEAEIFRRWLVDHLEQQVPESNVPALRPATTDALPSRRPE